MATLMIFVGIALLVISIMQLAKLSKYEFENRTTGGVIEHKNFGDSVKHNTKRALYCLLLVASLITIVISYLARDL